MSNQTLSNGFSDLVVPVCEGGTNDSATLSLSFDGIDQGAKGTIETLEAAGAITAWARVNDASRADTFRLKPTSSGYKALPAALTIDGVTVQPSIRLEGEDASASGWTAIAGNDLTVQGTGADPEFDENTPGIDCARVKFKGGKRFEQASEQADQIGTDDFVMELIYTHTTTLTYCISVTTSGTIFYTNGSALAVSFNASPAFSMITGLIDGATYHVIIFADRSGNLKAYVNSVAGATTSIVAAAAQNISGTWALGARAGTGSAPYTGSVSYFALWHRASWLAFADYAGIAAKRFAQCCGVYAGTAQPLNPGFVDLDFETAGTASWTPASGAILSKEAGARTGGSGSQVLRVLGDGATSFPRAMQTKAGGITRVTGWARSDGTALPTMLLSSTFSWTGTTSTTWQYFDVAVKSFSYVATRIEIGVNGAAGYVEWDDITIEVDGAIPTAQARTTVAHLEKWNTAGTESYLIPVGAGWMRTDKIKAQDGNFLTGVRVESGVTNLFLYSEDFSNAAWTKTRVTLGTAITGLGGKSFSAIVASSDSDTHLLTQAVTSVASEQHSVSIFAKAGAVNSIRMENAETPTQYAYFNLSTGAIGDVGAGFALSIPARIEDKGNGFYRLEFRPVAAGATATVNIYLSNGSTVGSETFTGDGSTVSAYLFGAQFESNTSESLYYKGVGSSYMPTTSATVSRVKDTLSYHGYKNAVGETADALEVSVKYYGNHAGASSVGHRALFNIGDNTSSNRILLYRVSASDNINLLMSVSGGAQATPQGGSNVFGDSESQVSAIAIKDYTTFSQERGSFVAPDTSCSLPVKTTINIGGAYGGAFVSGAMITDFAISPYGLALPRAILALDKPSHTQSAFIGYDALDDSTYELRAGAGTTRGVTLNGGVLSPAAWHLISLEWSGGTSISLKIDGVEVDSAVADATISGLTDLLIAWCGLKGYAYEPSAGALSYPITFGAVSIADVQLHSAAPPAAWYTEMIARGVPAKNEHLIHQISQNAQLGATHYDLLTGTAGTLTEFGANDFVPPTEVGLALGANAVNKTIVDFGSSFAFMQATSHSYDAWIRVDGSGDQCIWANGDENTSDFQALLYDDATDSLVYTCVVGATVRSVSAAIELDRLYHVAVTRAYSSGAGTTTLTIYIDSEPIESQVYTGAPVITNDAFVMLSSSEAAGVFTLPFIGATVGNRFYDDALTLAEIEAIYAADSLVMINGPYATQAITAATLPATISGAVMPDGTGGYPIVLVQAESDGEWRAIGSAESLSAWSTFEKATPVNAIRLYAKSYNTYAQSAAYFDDLDGGTDPGDSTIGLVEVAKNKRKALENIVLMRKPLHSWAVMVVRYV